MPPHSIEAEQAVLGGLTLDNDAWVHVNERIKREDFYRRDHGEIYNAIEMLANENKPFDVVTLAEWLHGHELLDSVGGMGYLAQLAENTPSAANIAAYADIVRQRAVLRELISAGSKITESAFRPEGREPDELLDAAESLVFEIAERESRGRRGFRPIKELLVDALERIDELFQRDNPITGVATGFYDLDMMTSGLQKSDLVIVAGRPSMGENGLCAEYRAERCDQGRAPGCPVQHGNAERTIGDAHDVFAGAHRPAQGAYRQVERRRLAAPYAFSRYIV